MHIPDAVLSAPVLIAGTAVAAGGVAIGLRRMSEESMVRVAVLSSAFFVASLIHVPLGPASVHLVLAGLCGVLLGWGVFPAVAIALVLQALFFGYGGITTLGVNTAIMATPGIACFYLFNRPLRTRPLPWVFPVGFAAGALGILLGSFLLAACLVMSGREFAVAGGAIFLAQLPLIAVEGFVTAFAVSFLRKARPEVLAVPGPQSAHWHESPEVT